MIARNTQPVRILITDADRCAAQTTADALARHGFEVDTAATFADACDAIAHRAVDIVLADEHLSGTNPTELMQIAAKRSPRTAFVITSAHPVVTRAVEAIKLGANDYLAKPISEHTLVECLDRVVAVQALVGGNNVAKNTCAKTTDRPAIIGNDYRMQRVFELVDSVAPTKATVLLQGASGTGKSLIAGAIHQQSDRRRRPFVEVSCGALPETLLESELFGHLRGAFTGAVTSKAGKFKLADGGTIFLDEISAASPALQTKLLRVLQSQQFEPVGSNKTQEVDVRVILATNLDLEAEIRAGRFREDLFYRINVVTIDLPKLADRTGDIPLLAEYFLGRAALAHNRPVQSITDEAMERLVAYDWPGNIRELENTIDRAVILCNSHRITAGDLTDRVRFGRPARTVDDDYRPIPLKDALAEPERRILECALHANGWNRQTTADQLGINRTTLYKKMKRHGLDRGPINRC